MAFLLSHSSPKKLNLLKAAWGRGPGLWGTAEACETRPRRPIAPGAGAGHQADPFSIRPSTRSPEDFIRGFLSSSEYDCLDKILPFSSAQSIAISTRMR